MYGCLESQNLHPDFQEITKVVPVFIKKSNKNDVNNYRPISVLSQFNKIFEKVIQRRLLSFFTTNQTLYTKQFGFQKNKSTHRAIIDLQEYILRNAEQFEITCCLFLNTQKAFDSVNHHILLDKLEHYGIRGNALSILKSYLTNRKQYTVIHKHESSIKNIVYGVPEGSVLAL